MMPIAPVIVLSDTAMANGRESSQDENICRVCLSIKDVDGICPNQCKDYIEQVNFMFR